MRNFLFLERKGVFPTNSAVNLMAVETNQADFLSVVGTQHRLPQLRPGFLVEPFAQGAFDDFAPVLGGELAQETGKPARWPEFV